LFEEEAEVVGKRGDHGIHGRKTGVLKMGFRV